MVTVTIMDSIPSKRCVNPDTVLPSSFPAQSSLDWDNGTVTKMQGNFIIKVSDFLLYALRCCFIMD